ncbi:uncharacterized protein LOC111355863 [Spodoptera litura]|uniref:Uncharacterized protein LOC111355863 n=1 Tax=Spodoptera litura TaxID=69820 RepID=A0A9J7ISK8_SPOLT|nr:uncharacterized protein LOC111355863 [Spodoptera litura]
MADSWLFTCVLVIICFSLPTFSEGNKCDFYKGRYKAKLVPDVKWPLMLRKGQSSFKIDIPMTWHLVRATRGKNLRISFVCVQIGDGKNTKKEIKKVSINILLSGISARAIIKLKKPMIQNRRLTIQLFGKPRKK